jgi:apolipoprotein D and lipocalin family protein
MEYSGILTILTVVLMATTQVNAQASNSGKAGLVTVDSVDLSRYVGTWYEIAKIPNSFQSKCARNTTATYTLRSDGDIDVLNRCEESDGSENVAKGIAKVVDRKTNAKLEVSFVRILGIQLFWGDYWIIGLDSNYRYAVVGTPSRKYGWILSRTPTFSPDDMKVVRDVLRREGYDPGSFVQSEQTITR